LMKTFAKNKPVEKTLELNKRYHQFPFFIVQRNPFPVERAGATWQSLSAGGAEAHLGCSGLLLLCSVTSRIESPLEST
jgi:hypothetical protein